MRVEFSEHALERLKARNIPKRTILSALKNPDGEEKSYKERRIARKKIQRKTLEVVTKKEGNKILVITAYFLWK